MRIARPEQRRFGGPPEGVRKLVAAILALEGDALAAQLAKVREWPYGKTDLLDWVDALNRLDEILAGIVASYGLAAIQTREVGRADRELARAILVFLKILAENSSNKSVFGSFDVVEPFVYAFELDLAVAALYLVAFFASKVHIQRSIRNTLGAMRLDDLKILLDFRVKPQRYANLYPLFSYYDAALRRTAKVNVKKLLRSRGGLFGVVEEMAEKIPRGELRRFAHLLRTHALYHREFERLVMTKLLAFGIMVYHKHTELMIDSEYIHRDFTDVLEILREGSYEVKEAAVAMIDSLFRMRIRHAALISAMEAHLYNGIVMTLLRKVVEQEGVPEQFIHTFFNFLSSFFASVNGATALYSAGIVEYLCSSLRSPEITPMIKMRLVLCTNTLLFTIPAPFNRFVADAGMDLLARELAGALAGVLAAPRAGEGSYSHALLQQAVDEIDYALYETMHYIRAILKLVSQLFQNASTAEAMRGFLEGRYPESVCTIFGQSDRFLDAAVAYAISAVGDYVHAEPGNLGVVIEKGVAERFFALLARGIPPNADFIVAVPNMVEALALNAELLEQIRASTVIADLMAILIDEAYADLVESYDIATSLGTFVEELVRHCPSLRDAADAAAVALVSRLAAAEGARPEAFLLFVENILKFLGCLMYSPAHVESLVRRGIVDTLFQLLSSPMIPNDFIQEGDTPMLIMEVVKKIDGEYSNEIAESLSSRVHAIVAELHGARELGLLASSGEIRLARLSREFVAKFALLRRLLILTNNLLITGVGFRIPETLAKMYCRRETLERIEMLNMFSAVAHAVMIRERVERDGGVDELANLCVTTVNLFGSIVVGMARAVAQAALRAEAFRAEFARLSSALLAAEKKKLSFASFPYYRTLIAPRAGGGRELYAGRPSLLLEAREALESSSIHLPFLRNLILNDRSATAHFSTMKFAVFKEGVDLVLVDYVRHVIEIRNADEMNPAAEPAGEPSAKKARGERNEGDDREILDKETLSAIAAVLDIFKAVLHGVAFFEAEREAVPPESRRMEQISVDLIRMVYPKHVNSEILKSILAICARAFRVAGGALTEGLASTLDYDDLAEVAHHLSLAPRAPRGGREQRGGARREAPAEAPAEAAGEGKKALGEEREALKKVMGEYAYKITLDLSEKKIDPRVVSMMCIFAEDAAAVEEMFASRRFELLAKLQAKVPAVFGRVEERLAGALAEIEGGGGDRALLTLVATHFVLGTLFRAQGRSVRALAWGPAASARLPALAARDVEGALVLAIAVLRRAADEGAELEADAFRGLLGDAIGGFDRISSRERVAVAGLLNILVRRMTESRHSVREGMREHIRMRYSRKSRPVSLKILCETVEPLAFYAPEDFCAYVETHFVRVPGAHGDFVRHAIPDETDDGLGDFVSFGTGRIYPEENMLLRPLQTYADVRAAPFHQLLALGGEDESALAMCMRIQLLCELLFAYPQLGAGVRAEEFAHFAAFLGTFYKTKRAAETEQEKCRAYWCGYIVVVCFNYADNSALKDHLVGMLVEKIRGSSNGVYFTMCDLLYKILTAKFNREMFLANLKIFARHGVVELVVERLAQIDQNTAGFAAIAERIARLLEYATRVLALGEDRAFYEDPAPSEEEASDDESEAYMEDFDTDETMDSDRLDLSGEETSEEEASSSTIEDVIFVESDERFFLPDSPLFDQPYRMPDEIRPRDAFVPGEEDSPDHEFFRSLAVHSAAKRYRDEMKLFLDKFFDAYEFLGARLVGALGEAEGERSAADSSSQSLSSYDEGSEEFGSEDAPLGDVNGDIPPMDVDVLNSLPEDVLRETVSEYYRDRRASATSYRPISTVFLAGLAEPARGVFEEEEEVYSESFGAQPRRAAESVEAEEEPAPPEIRDGPRLVSPQTLAQLVSLCFCSLSNRRTLFRILNNVTSSLEVRRELLGVLVANLNLGGERVKRTLEIISYLAMKSDDFVILFAGEASLLNRIVAALRRRRCIGEFMRLLAVAARCFSLEKAPGFAPQEIVLDGLLEAMDVDMSDEVFDYMLRFVEETAGLFRDRYVQHVIGAVVAIISEFCESPDVDLEKISTSKSSVRLHRYFRVLRAVGAERSAELAALEAHDFWKLFFWEIAKRERGNAFLTSLLPLFHSFFLLSTIVGETPFYHEIVEKHKETLNYFVSGNPDLLFGPLGPLVRSKILDFDNKRVYFYRKLEGERAHRSTLTLAVDRASLFEDTFHQLMRHTGEEIRDGRFNIKFAGEEGVDGGGLTREWYSELSKEMFNPNYALFTPIGPSYQPNPHSHVNPEHLLYFKFIGRIIAKAIHDAIVLDCYFTRPFYKFILSIRVDLADLESVDPGFFRSLRWILDNPIEGVLELTLSSEVEAFGESREVDLKPGGRHTTVTDANKAEYVELITEFRLVRAIELQMRAFKEGFFEILSEEMVRLFDEKELELLISGLPEIDVDDWRNNTLYVGYTANSVVTKWFWRAVRNFSMEERAKLLQFATGTSKLPLEGFAGLRGTTGPQKFQIHKDAGGRVRLPTAHTCFNQLDLPEYDSYESLLHNLRLSLEECPTGFGFI